MTDLGFAAHVIQTARRPLTERGRREFDRSVLGEPAPRDTAVVRMTARHSSRQRLVGILGIEAPHGPSRRVRGERWPL